MAGFIYYALALLLVAGIGVVVRFIFNEKSNKDFCLTRTEWIAGLLVAALVVIPLTSLVGAKVAKANATTYNEYWSGLEKAADMKTINCEKNGSCAHTYQCDPHEVLVTKTRQVPYTTTESYTDSNGNMQTRTVTKYRTETYQEWETHYHSCPYTTQEFTFTVKDTLGETYNFGRNLFPAQAEAHRWKGNGYNEPRSGFGMPSLPKNVKQGIPSDWQAVKDRLAAGNPGGTTKRVKYTNYIQASKKDIYDKHSGDVEAYRKAGLMPKVQDKTHGHYSADKVYFVKTQATDAKDWQFALQRFNGYFGKERTGDLHLTVVDPNRVSASDADRYSLALEAWWAHEQLGRNTLSKNGVGLVIAPDSSGKIVWARAFTPMPEGNEKLIIEARNLAGTDFNPEALLAPETGSFWKMAMEGDSAYERVEMKNYQYLYDSLEIGTTARIVILLLGVFLSSLLWAAMLVVNLRIPAIDDFEFSVAGHEVPLGPEGEGSKGEWFAEGVHSLQEKFAHLKHRLFKR